MTSLTRAIIGGIAAVVVLGLCIAGGYWYTGHLAGKSDQKMAGLDANMVKVFDKVGKQDAKLDDFGKALDPNTGKLGRALVGRLDRNVRAATRDGLTGLEGRLRTLEVRPVPREAEPLPLEAREVPEVRRDRLTSRRVDQILACLSDRDRQKDGLRSLVTLDEAGLRALDERAEDAYVAKDEAKRQLISRAKTIVLFAMANQTLARDFLEGSPVQQGDAFVLLMKPLAIEDTANEALYTARKGVNIAEGADALAKKGAKDIGQLQVDAVRDRTDLIVTKKILGDVDEGATETARRVDRMHEHLWGSDSADIPTLQGKVSRLEEGTKRLPGRWVEVRPATPAEGRDVRPPERPAGR